MSKSLRWRLQIWHAVILAMVVIGFASALYFQIRRTTMIDIDEELLSGARIIEAQLRRPGPLGPLPQLGPPWGRPPHRGDDRFGGDRFGGDRRPRRDMGPRDFRDHGPPPVGPQAFGPRPPREQDGGPNGVDLSISGYPLPGTPGRGAGNEGPSLPIDPAPHPNPLPTEYRGEREQTLLKSPPFDGGPRGDQSRSDGPGFRFRRGPDDEPPYFAVFGPRGETLMGDHDLVTETPIQPRREFLFRSLGSQREVILKGPGERLIVVGRDTNPIMQGLYGFLVPISFSGLAVLAAGLLGGWWLSGRAIEPLQRISDTASSISAKNLDERIDVTKMDTELEQLGSILNSMLERLDQSFQQQTRFVADASHELRTPLSVLLMHCELALSRDRKPQEYQQTLATCLRASQRMRSLVEDLLMLARADAEALVLRKSSVDVSELVEESVRLLAPMAQQYNVTVDLKSSPSLCEGDSNHLLRLFNNLLNNAIVYNRPGGSIQIESAVVNEEVRVVIRDTGYGMSPEETSKVFERFYRVDDARSRDTGGSGLGLAICKSIATAHGGDLIMTSAINLGTTVEFRVPAMTTKASADSMESSIIDPPAESSSQ